MKTWIARVFVAVAAWALAGCLPATWTVVPALRGRVVDSKGEPISGAKVKVTGWEAEHLLEMKSGNDGRFSRKEEVTWALVPLLPLDAIGPTFRATASYGEMRSEPAEVREGITNAHFLGIGNETPPVDFGELVIKGLPLK